MEYLRREEVLWNVLLQLSTKEIQALCSQLEGACDPILSTNVFWRNKLETKGIRTYEPVLPDYKRVYELINGFQDVYDVFLKNISDLSLVRVLVESEYIDLSKDSCKAIRVAVDKGLLDITKYLLNKSNICTKHSPLLLAALKGDYEMVKLILNKFDVDINKVVLAYLYAHPKARISPFPNPSENNRELTTPNSEAISMLLLNHPTVNFDSDLLYYGILAGNERIILKIIKSSKDLTIKNNLLIRLAAEDGHYDIVKRILSKVDPSALNNEALSRAVYHGYYDIVELLLTDFRVRKRGVHQALQYANLRNDLEIIELLLPHTNDIDRPNR